MEMFTSPQNFVWACDAAFHYTSESCFESQVTSQDESEDIQGNVTKESHVIGDNFKSEAKVLDKSS
ncbi:Hypothetical protein SMAX5B_015311 [Scophthalmus maximus]|uniref:Uncharacterized protein n=1 Tax=Scophthalmus maximus TaxID=52904 RepID=A0A2U9B6L5_SCOMX|nr:Hypothetical protein SMAX5B_015311 [Scophthalmus maximus]